jgi:hypothetical protein
MDRVKEEGNNSDHDGGSENDVQGYEHFGLLSLVLGEERGAPFEAHHQVRRRP